MNPSVKINIRRTQVAEHRVERLQAALDIEQYGHEATRKLWRTKYEQTH